MPENLEALVRSRAARLGLAMLFIAVRLTGGSEWSDGKVTSAQPMSGTRSVCFWRRWGSLRESLSGERMNLLEYNSSCYHRSSVS